MLSKDPSYRRLKTGGYGLSGSASYWLGADHLFVVVMNGYVERYHRFMFGDIQAVIIRRNRLQLAWSMLFAVALVAAVLGAWTASDGRSPANLEVGALTGFIILASMALVFLLLLILNVLLGPTCVCHLRTAVQTLPLPQVGRWRKAELLARELAPLVSAAQVPATLAAATTTPIRVDVPEALEPDLTQPGSSEPDAPPQAAL